MRKRLMVVAALMSAVALLASGCGTEDTGAPADGRLSGVSIVFNVSLAEEERATIQDLIEDFQRETGASIELSSVATADLPEKLRVEVEAGRPTIHLFAVDNLGLRVLVDEDLVEDLSEVEIPDGVIEAMIPDRFDDRQLFLPFRPNVRVAYANIERFESVGADLPTTVEELRSVAEAFRAEAGSGKVTLSLAEGDPAAVTLSEWIVMFGGDPLLLNDEGSVAAFEFIQSMWQDDLLARESLLGKFDTEVDHLQGEIAWLAQNWPFTTGALAETGILDRFRVYKGWTGPERGAHVVGGDVLGIPRGVDGRQREAALELAQFLMSREAQARLAAENAWPSIREDAYTEVPEEQQETFDAIQAALEDGWYRPNVVYWPDVTEAMNEALRRIVQGGEDAQAVLDEVHEKVATAAERKGAEYPPTD